MPEARLDDLIFAGAFDTDYLQSLTPDRIAAFGPGIYPESRLDRFAPPIEGSAD